jgi:peptidoglycan DL-endopeptidase CwlO
MDLRKLALSLATDLTAHQRKLRNSADDADRLRENLRAAGTELAERRRHARRDAEATLRHWTGETADAVERRSARLSRNIDVTATSCERAAEIVGRVTESVSSGQLATQRLVDEYATRAERVIRQGMAADDSTVLMRAVTEVTDRLVPHYTKESAAELRRVDTELAEAAQRLKALTHHVKHDDVAEGTRSPIRIPVPDSGRKPHHGKHKRDEHRGRNVDEILRRARKQLGYHERGDNINKFGPDLPWCSSFVTSIWRDAGVNIDLLPATEDVYFWGREHGQAYGKHNLDEVQVGDALLFGSGPTPAGSTHIGIVESIDGNQVTLIEGNSDDQVQRVTHTLSPSTFYGGVHPS